MPNISIREFLVGFENGAFTNKNRETQIKAGWHDWFCRDTSLAAKTEKLGKYVKRIAEAGIVDIDTHYVFFKNNCPMDGSLYDSFSICELKTGDVVYWICPSNGHRVTKGETQLASQESEWESTTFKNMKELIEHLVKIKK